MIKRIASGFAALGLASAAAVALPSTASADYGDGRDACNKGAFCVWYMSRYADKEIEDWNNDSNWGSKISYDDMSWFNNGTVWTGADHVRVYPYRDYAGSPTLCIHQGASGTVRSGDSDDQGDLIAAMNKGRSHRWGGECSSSEPQVD